MASGRKSKPKYRALFISVVISVLLLAAGVHFIDHMTGTVVAKKLCKPLVRLLFLIGIGLVAGQVIEAAGWTKHLAKLAGPLFRFAGLGPGCSAAFTSAFVSGVAANAMLLGFYKDGSISRRQLYLSNFINQFPAYFLHLPTTFFIVVPLTGRAGLLYFALTFLALLLRTFGLLVFGHFFVRKGTETGEGHPDHSENSKKPEKKSWDTIWEGIKKRFPARMTNIVIYVLPIYVLVFVVNYMGLFDVLNRVVSKYVVTTFMPMESLSVVVLGFVAEFTSGFAAAGALMKAGVLTIKQTALALLIGNIIAFPIRALRHQLPRYVGIFSPRMGIQILLGGQSLRVMSLMITGVVFYYVMP